ncbi:MAG: Alpha/beta hydrolase fold protein [Candidatus Dadabacteria bacterium CSP1-2]|nr:MAG: Alpha/beta hydrolase fold protein [Candidatus Dadabacteria bacterium CSP1-2]
MPSAFVKGLKINYIAGEGLEKSRLSILMIHGAGQSSLTWEYQVDELKKQSKFNLIILDLPGHGKSEGSGLSSIREYSGFIKDFTDTLGLENLILVGHSMGGGIVQVFTIDYPDTVYACVLVGTGARLRVAKETLEAVKNNYEAYCKIAPTRAFASSSPEELKKRFVEGIIRTPQSVVRQDFIACDEFDIMNKVEKIKVPTLIISATEDILTPVRYGEYLHNRIEGSKFHVIKDVGHFMMQEKADEFNRVLLEFLISLC